MTRQYNKQDRVRITNGACDLYKLGGKSFKNCCNKYGSTPEAILRWENKYDYIKLISADVRKRQKSKGKSFTKQERIDVVKKICETYKNDNTTIIECCKKHDLCPTTFYKWNRGYEYINEICENIIDIAIREYITYRKHTEKERNNISKNIMNTYNSTNLNLVECCKKHKLNSSTFFRWCRKYPEVREPYHTKIKKKIKRRIKIYSNKHIMLINKYETKREYAFKQNEFLIVTKKECVELFNQGFGYTDIARIIEMSESSVRALIKTNQQKCRVGSHKRKTQRIKDGTILKIWEHVNPKEILRIVKLLSWNRSDSKEALTDYLYEYFYSRDIRSNWAKIFLSIPTEDKKLGYMYYMGIRARMSFYSKRKKYMVVDTNNEWICNDRIAAY